MKRIVVVLMALSFLMAIMSSCATSCGC